LIVGYLSICNQLLLEHLAQQFLGDCFALKGDAYEEKILLILRRRHWRSKWGILVVVLC